MEQPEPLRVAEEESRARAQHLHLGRLRLRREPRRRREERALRRRLEAAEELLRAARDGVAGGGSRPPIIHTASALARGDLIRPIFRSALAMPLACVCGDDCASTRMTIIDFSAMMLCE